MSDDIVAHAEPIPQTGEPTWTPPIEDDAEARLNADDGLPPQRDWRYIFVGRDGLRAGWSIGAFLLIAVALSAVINLFMKYVLHHKPTRDNLMTARGTIIGEAISFAVFALAAVVMSRIERRRFSRYGLGMPRVGQFVVGALWGAAVLSSLVALLHWRGLLVFTGQAEFGAAAVRWGLLWLLAFLGVGFFEEFFSRGYLQYTLTRGLAGMGEALGMQVRSRRVVGFWVAALFFSFIFGFGHKGNPGESAVGLWSAGLIGLVFAYSLWRTGSLWWAIGYHMAWDWMQSFVFGVADSGLMVQHHLLNSHPQGPVLWSGGLTGPEGSVFVLAECLITALVVRFTLPKEPGSASWASEI